jgi:tyrosyl-tRNA synthetase
MWRYYDLLSFRDSQVIDGFKNDVAGGRNPRDIKVLLAQEIVERFHGAVAGSHALADFEARFRHGAVPDDILDIYLDGADQSLNIALVLKRVGLTASTSEAWRMLEQGGVKIDGTKITDKNMTLASCGTFVIQVGKRKFARVHTHRI